jgi:hypothetical protein
MDPARSNFICTHQRRESALDEELVPTTAILLEQWNLLHRREPDPCVQTGV